MVWKVLTNVSEKHIQGVSEGKVNILGGGKMEYSE
jgi:hypothetical protein